MNYVVIITSARLVIDEVPDCVNEVGSVYKPAMCKLIISSFEFAIYNYKTNHQYVNNMNNSPRMPILRYHGQNPLALPAPRAMPALRAPTRPITLRMPTPVNQIIPTTPCIRRHNISRKCIHCKVIHIGGPLQCPINKMRMRPIKLTTSSTQTDRYSCSTCDLSAAAASPSSSHTALPAPLNSSPALSTYSSLGPLSPNLVQTSPPNFPQSPTLPSTSSQATKPSVSNAGPLILHYKAALQRKKDNPSFTQAKSLENIMSLTSFKETRYIAELFIVDKDRFVALQSEQRNVKVLRKFNDLCKVALQQQELKPVVRQAKRESQIF